jgi:hypothetical protein
VHESARTVRADTELVPYGAVRSVRGDQIAGADDPRSAAGRIAQDDTDAVGVALDAGHLGTEPHTDAAERAGVIEQHALGVVLRHALGRRAG